MDTTQGTTRKRRGAPKAAVPLMTAEELAIFGPEPSAVAPADPAPVADPVTEPEPLPATGAAQLAEEVRRVQTLRHALEERRDALAEAQRQFNVTHATELLDAKEWAVRVEAAEMGLKALALAHFKRTGEAKPTAGVEVKLFKGYEYDAAVALAWAKDKQMALIPEALDRKALDKIASVTPLPFVTITETPKAQIAVDLDKALGGAQ